MICHQATYFEKITTSVVDEITCLERLVKVRKIIFKKMKYKNMVKYYFFYQKKYYVFLQLPQKRFNFFEHFWWNHSDFRRIDKINIFKKFFSLNCV